MNLKIFSFAFRLFLILGIVIWMNNNPGTLTLKWLGYDIETSLSFVLLFFLAIFLTIALLTSGWHGLVWIVRQVLNIGTYLKKDPNKVLAQAFSAIEFGNWKEAQDLAKEAMSLNPESALPAIVLLKAATLLEDKKTQSLALIHLKKFDEFAPIAFYNEIEDAIKNQRLEAAKKLLTQAEKKYKEEAWFLKESLKLAISQSSWDKALDLLKKAIKKGGFTEKEANKIYAFLWHKMALEKGLKEEEKLTRLEKSYDYDPDFLDNLLTLSCLLAQRKDKRAAQTLLEKAWSEAPSWLISETYCELLSKNKQPLAQAHYARKLYELRPDHPVSQLILIKYFIQAKLWGEAKRVLSLLPKDVPEAHVLKAALAKKEKDNKVDVLNHLKKALTQISYPYKCKSCRQSLDHWSITCAHCGTFLSVYLKHPITYADCVDVLE